MSKIFGIIDNVDLNDSRETDGQGALFCSRIVWNQTVLDSFQAGYLRSLDFHLAISFKHVISMRIYRFMGKRFHLQPEWTFDLKDFACEHIGLARNYEGGVQLVRKLKPAIEELEGVGFLAPLPENERFSKKGRDWSIRLIQPSPALTSFAETPPVSEAATPPLVSDLVQRGITKAIAEELVQRHSAEMIQQKLDVFDWLVEKQDKRAAKNPAGFLRRAIETDYATPKGFESRAERQARAAAQHQAERKVAEERRRQHEQEAKRQRANAYIKQLGQAERLALEAEALAAATPEQRENYDSHVMARFRDTLMLAMLRDYVAEKLDREQVPAEA